VRFRVQAGPGGKTAEIGVIAKVRTMRREEWRDAQQLLTVSGLPVDDLQDDSWRNFLVANENDRLVGVVAVEPCGTTALLRSLAVEPSLRGKGIGKTLVRAAEGAARARGATRVCLLTITVEKFFASESYRRAPRESAPADIRNHAQFKSLCPASAIFMEKDLEPEPSVRRVLFLCTGNSARSVLAEALLNHLGRGKFLAFSAGSQPTGKINPFAIEALKLQNIPSGEPRSKSWDEFARAESLPIDIVITVCDNAAGEVCPIWPGHPLTAHWGVDDPAAAEGTHEQKLAAFHTAFSILKYRIEQLIRLNFGATDAAVLKNSLVQIGKSLPSS
jgi:protein-tyrosine-phosphatase/N-acetylglutamate synthase-like GNAT family acetyltransferase